MTTIETNRRLFHAVLYFLAACILLAILANCSPLNAYQVTATPRPIHVFTSLARVQDERFLYHNAGDWKLSLTAPGRKAGPHTQE
jgi:hypothetical protein